jgi:hypothetical protein
VRSGREQRATREQVTLGDMAEFLGERSIVGLLLAFALLMVLLVPAPGLSVLFGVPLILLSAQLTLGYRRAWLPARLARRSISRSTFLMIVDRTLPTLRWLERIVRPRAQQLAGPWARVPVGIICLVLAIIITLPVPLGHVVPGTAISILPRSGSSNAMVSLSLSEYSLRFSVSPSRWPLRQVSSIQRICGGADG